MKELTAEDLKWRKGFEAGVAFTLRHIYENNDVSIDTLKLVGDLNHLRPWKSIEEWYELVRRSRNLAP